MVNATNSALASKMTINFNGLSDTELVQGNPNTLIGNVYDAQGKNLQGVKVDIVVDGGGLSKAFYTGETDINAQAKFGNIVFSKAGTVTVAMQAYKNPTTKLPEIQKTFTVKAPPAPPAPAPAPAPTATTPAQAKTPAGQAQAPAPAPTPASIAFAYGDFIGPEITVSDKGQDFVLAAVKVTNKTAKTGQVKVVFEVVSGGTTLKSLSNDISVPANGSASTSFRPPGLAPGAKYTLSAFLTSTDAKTAYSSKSVQDVSTLASTAAPSPTPSTPAPASPNSQSATDSLKAWAVDFEDYVQRNIWAIIALAAVLIAAAVGLALANPKVRAKIGAPIAK